MINLTKRQSDILEIIKRKGVAGNSDIVDYFKKNKVSVSRITIVREFDELLNMGLVEKIGRGRSIQYREKVRSNLLTYFNVNKYFKKDPDERAIAHDGFNFDVFKNIADLFTDDEIGQLNLENQTYLKRMKMLSSTLIQKEVEKLMVELSWKSSQIEGNTYSLLDTETLIKEKKEAKGHRKEEAIMILNHKKSLDYIYSYKKDYKKIGLRKIEDIHRLLVDNLNINVGIRKGTVGIIGTRYKPIDNQFQIKEALEKTIEVINKIRSPFSKALVAVLMISYIQPFEDGNKRTARLLGNAILLAYNICPISYRSIKETDYKKAIILFYEQNSARSFKELFIEQFKFAVKNYF